MELRRMYEPAICNWAFTLFLCCGNFYQLRRRLFATVGPISHFSHEGRTEQYCSNAYIHNVDVVLYV